MSRRPSSLPIVGHRWSASTSFVLAALRALHVDSSGAATDAAMIEEGTTTPRPVRRVTRTGRLFRFGSYDNKPKPRGPSPVRATTAFKRLIAARGVSVTNVDFGRDQVCGHRPVAQPQAGLSPVRVHDQSPVRPAEGGLVVAAPGPCLLYTSDAADE